MDIGGWLRSLGLEEHEAAFGENKVDAAVLPKLTAEDLKDLGIAAVGDRRKLLEAIAALRTDTCVKTPSADEAIAPSAATARPEDLREGTDWRPPKRLAKRLSPPSLSMRGSTRLGGFGRDLLSQRR